MRVSLKNPSSNLRNVPRPNPCCLLAAFLLLFAFPRTSLYARSPEAEPAAAGGAEPEATQASSEGAVDPAKEADIRRLMELTHATGMADQAIQPFLEALRRQLASNLPRNIEQRNEIATRFAERFTARFTRDKLVQLIIPVFDKNFSHEEINETLRFYESATGRHFVEAMPVVMQESQAAAEKLSQELVPQVLEEIEQEFPALKQLR